jgi:hypothetical protein
MPRSKTASGAVIGASGWSQSGRLTAGKPSQIVPMQVNFDSDQDAVHTLLFGITPATTPSGNQQQPQPTPTPPNPLVVDANGNPSLASVTNGSPNVLFPPPSANPVIGGNPAPALVAGQLLQFSNDPTRIYSVSSFTPPSTLVLTLPFRGTSQLRAGVSLLGNATIPLAPPAVPVTPLPVDCVAIIQFTIAGVKIQRIISIANGASISGPGEAIQVLLIDNTLAPGSFGYAYDVTVTVSPGVRAAITRPMLYWNYPPTAIITPSAGPTVAQPFNLVNIPPATFISLPIPVNAGINTLNLSSYDFTAPATPPVINVGQRDSGGTFVRLDYSPTGTVFLPVAPDATVIQIINPSATDTISVSVTWGIDG